MIELDNIKICPLAGIDDAIIIQSLNKASLTTSTSAIGPAVAEMVTRHGAVLLRGFAPEGTSAMAALFASLQWKPLQYTYRSTPRTSVSEGIYTATEFPASEEIMLHSENAFQADWPTRIGFHCAVPARAGGETPIGSLEKITARIDTGLFDEFRRRGVSYVRNYSDYVDLPWQVVFQSSDRGDVEEYCKNHGIGFEWRNSGLRTWQACQGTATHPERGNEVWFNQAHMFHYTALGPEMASNLLSIFGEEELPRNAYYGDGGVIPKDAVEHIREAFSAERASFGWEKDDILLLDNMRYCHGRNPFEGPRQVLVSMGRGYASVVDSSH
ncbi:SyrP-like protein (plasmid) [Allorhizobium ampelinum S4]|uniref:SyrP-like protein n=1 Tax=Allorhizobium ampelinum (strain ATCC BAA-846 / DSM 112012 / S4) TaxID=311402 RepID=B9K398_ALLAM|nr:TauD/TfdA family dioxygenase [Allorhizobium ampelinum]ACM39346.1 SyrP-like protein [Allorhizobium ampelinum S4]